MRYRLTAAILLSSCCAMSAASEHIYCLTAGNNLIEVDIADLSTVLHSVPITGLENNAELRGIEFNTTTSLLYGLAVFPGNQCRLYNIDYATGVTTPLGDISTLPSLSSAQALEYDDGYEFRIIGEQGENFRINATYGLVGGPPPHNGDPAVRFASGDVNSGTPAIVALAHQKGTATPSNAFMFGLDSTRDILVNVSAPNVGPTDPTFANTGLTTTIGPVGIDFTNNASFDISPLTGTAFAALDSTGDTLSKLYQIDLVTGAATLIGTIGGGELIRGMTVSPFIAGAGSFQFSSAEYTVNEVGGAIDITVVRTGGSTGTASISYTASPGTANGLPKPGPVMIPADFIDTYGSLSFADGETTKTFRILIYQDDFEESPETVLLEVSRPTGGAALGSPNHAVLTITDQYFPPLPVTKARIKLNFAKENKDMIQIAGTIPLNGALDGKTFALNVGGVSKSFVLDARGSSKLEDAMLKIKPARDGKTGSFQATLKSGSFAAFLSDEGLTNTPTPQPAEKIARIRVDWDGQSYKATQNFLYKASAHSGTALLKK
jgi:hypothetical protein